LDFWTPANTKTPPHFEPQKTKDTPPFWTPLYIYIYTEGLFGGEGLGVLEGGFEKRVLVVLEVFLDGVGSARSLALDTGLSSCPHTTTT